MVGSYSYFFLNCTASDMVVCLERRGNIFYREKLQPGEAARVRSKSAGRFPFAVCCRTDHVAPPHLGDSFHNFWGEGVEATTPLSATGINQDPTARSGTTSIGCEPTACSSTTIIGRGPVARSTASVKRGPTARINSTTTSMNRGATPPRRITTRSVSGIAAEILAAAVTNNNAKKTGGNAGDVGRPAAPSISSSGNKENSDDGTRGGGEARGRRRGCSRSSFPGTRECEGGEARGRERRGIRSSSCSGGGSLDGSRAVVGSGTIVEAPVSARCHAHPHQPRHFKYRRPHFFAMCDTFCAFTGGGAEAISMHDLNEKIFRSYEPIIRRGEL